MGRSSQEKAALNRARIVEAASGLFRHHGVENVSVADVMGAAGMTVGGFYKHFESKEALLREAMHFAFEQAARSWQSVLDRYRGDAQLRLIALMEHYFTHRPPEYACPMLAFASPAAADAPGASCSSAYESGTNDLLSQFLAQTSAGGTPGDSNSVTEADGMLLFAAMVGAGFLTRGAGDTPWTRALRAAVSGAWERGLLRRR